MRRGIEGLQHLDRPPVKPLPTAPISFEEFLDWCEGDTRAEWVNGEVVLMAGVSERHEELVFWFAQLVGLFVRRRALGKVSGPEYFMKLENSARLPDFAFVSAARRSRFQTYFLDGPADLVVEVISPWSVTRDRRHKMREYEKAGVQEYWLIDPQKQKADFLVLGPDGKFANAPVDETGVYRSRTIEGFYLRVEWLWQEELPDPLDLLQELGVIRLSDGSGGRR
jgi:Uma2 family endonuclease